MFGIQITETGGPEVLVAGELDDPTAGAGELLVDVAAAGVNFIDVYHRTGLYPVPLPFVPGLEGAGTVAEVGAGIDSQTGDAWQVGDRVAWTTAPGSYASRKTLPVANAVRVPDNVDLDVAAAVMLQGLTAHYLVTDTYALQAGDKCLIHAGAGGVGLLLIQMAKMIGAEVFTTVGTAEKAELATGAGADHVILYRDVDFHDSVVDIAGEQALHVVYDGVGQSVFLPSLDLLRPRGTMATFGNASGPVDPISPIDSSAGRSLFITRPSLFNYITGDGELAGRSADLFDWIGSGQLDVRIGLELPVAEAAEAHRLLEGRATTGKVLLRP